MQEQSDPQSPARGGSFVCRRCGRCCGLIVEVTEEDSARIVRDERMARDEFELLVDSPERSGVKIMKRSPLDVGGRGDVMRCVFLRAEDDGSTSCAIYESRPEVCRMYPGMKRCLNA